MSAKIPLGSQKDFSSFPDLPCRWSPKWSLVLYHYASKGTEAQRFCGDGPTLGKPHWGTPAQLPADKPHTKPTASDPHSPLACCAPAPQVPWGLQVQCNGSAGSPRPGLHPCTQRTHPGWLLKGKQNLNPTGLKSLVEHNGFFPPHLSPEPWAHGLREQTLNEHSTDWQQLWR